MDARRWTKALSALLALILAAISALPMGGALAESDGPTAALLRQEE